MRRFSTAEYRRRALLQCRGTAHGDALSLVVGHACVGTPPPNEYFGPDVKCSLSCGMGRYEGVGLVGLTQGFGHQAVFRTLSVF